MSNFSKNLSFLLSDQKVSQLRLGTHIGKGRSVVGSYARGESEPKLSKKREIADFFGVTLFDLLECDLKNEGPGNHSVASEPSAEGYVALPKEAEEKLKILERENALLRKQIDVLEKHVALQEQMLKSSES